MHPPNRLPDPPPPDPPVRTIVGPPFPAVPPHTVAVLNADGTVCRTFASPGSAAAFVKGCRMADGPDLLTVGAGR